MLKRRSEVNRERSPIGHRGFPGQQFGAERPWAISRYGFEERPVAVHPASWAATSRQAESCVFLPAL